MMLTMHGLPPKTKYNEIKTLIKEKCNITDFILGTLGVDEDRTKNIRIGVASDREGDVIMKYLDGYRYSGHVLRIVPIGKPANETPQVNQWCNQQPESNYANPMNPGQQGVWPVQTNQQWSNTQPIQQQVPVQNNYEYVQPMVGQQNYYHQDRFPHNRGPQDGFSHNIPSNLIEPPRGNQPRPHAPINIVVTDQQQNRQPIQEGRYPNQGYNPEKPAISKQGFQGPSHMGPQPTQPGPAYIQGHQWPSQGPQDTSRFQKQNPPQFEKSSNKIIEPEKRQILPHNQERNIEHQYEKGGRRFSPPRDHKDSNHGRRVSPPGHRISPNGHRILPSGRRISPPPRSSQFKDGISPTGRRFSPQRQIHPSGRQMSPTGRQNLQPGGHLGRRISPPGRRFSPPAPQISPTGRQNSQSGRQNFQPGRRISPPGRRFSPHGRQVSPSGRRNSPPPRQIAPTGRPISPSGRRMSPSGRRFSPSGRRTSPSGRRTSPPGRQFSPIGRRSSPRGQRTSPSGRRISPMGRKLSPSGRRNSPERSFLPPGRRVSPGRGMSPSSRRISPTGRRMSPGRTSPERRVSPGHRITPMNKGPQGDRHMPQRMSPGKPTMGRKMSPGRNISPNCGPPPRSFDRYSPSRNPMDNIRGGPKEVRPAYAAMTQAQKQPMYSGGYPPDSRETEQYPPGPRKGDQRPEWQERQKPYQPPAKPVEDRRDIPGVQKYDSRRGGDYSRPVINQPENKVSSPGRMSRSPNRRDRSPTRDRYRRHSPSPRSPRRSWALEKRRSPNIIEPPPPPSWPERQENVYKSSRQHDEENIKKSVWDRPEAQKKQEVNSTFFRKEERHNYDQEEKKYFGSTSRTQWDSRDQPKQDDELRDRSPLRSRPSDRYSPTQTISKLPREDYDMTDRNEFEQQSPRYQEPRGELYQKREKIKDDYDEFRHKRDNYRQNFDDREEELYMGQENLDREIEDVYNRAAELTRKTEEYQRNRSSKTRFNPDYERRVEDDVFGIKDGPSKQDFYEASHSKFDKTPRHMGETVIVDLAPAVQYKRDKAVDDLTGKVLKKFVPNVKGKVRDDIEEQLKILIEDMIFEMFGDKDVSFIEIVIKFEEKHGTKGMEKIFDKVISKFPIEIRLMKRPAPDVSTSPIEIARSASTGSMKGAKGFSKPKFIREEPMRNSVAMKRTNPMYMREPAKRPMRYEQTLSKPPAKRFLPVKKDAPAKIIKKVSPTSGAVIEGKPVLNKDLSKKESETKTPTEGETSVKKTAELSKSEVSKNIPAISKISTSTITKPVTKAVVREERKDDAKDKAQEEHQGLSPMLSCALDSELEDVMIKVWQELPDESASKTEEHVVEKFRNEAGDDLRNVIGLNITKRLLNIHNSLYAKLSFKMRPERGALMDFIKKYNLKTFKRISDESPIFAAQFSNYEDYDRVCKDRVIYCGNVRVNVKACYNYKTCPQNLRTIFSQHDINTTNCENDKESDIKVTNEASPNKLSVKNKDSEIIKDVKSNETSTNMSVRTETNSERKSATNIGTKIDRIIIKIEKEEDKNNSVKVDKTKLETSNSIAQVEIKIEPTEDMEKVELNTSQIANSELQDTNINKLKDIKVKTESPQDMEENEKDDIANEQIVNLQTKIPESQVTQSNIDQQKEIKAITEPTHLKEGNENVKMKDDVKESKETINENEAIEDQDVLALISEGIVLDECSGSDVE
ncbi:PREDICTED: uncharacterized protein LOC106125742 isoform X2 [Papilio xuthus]|uniref:Uncharacterized protein LOC106125742 isoform X2 n=1 Tax=Papilio xuthus TaxID=66420 RepID=A0AAJ7EID0_PAPXU|nr:PREDICTED: uncharacterized protein LOC106125742 isoform X2 [Papilio xuthus]